MQGTEGTQITCKMLTADRKQPENGVCSQDNLFIKCVVLEIEMAGIVPRGHVKTFYSQFT